MVETVLIAGGVLFVFFMIALGFNQGRSENEHNSSADASGRAETRRNTDTQPRRDNDAVTDGGTTPISDIGNNSAGDTGSSLNGGENNTDNTDSIDISQLEQVLDEDLQGLQALMPQNQNGPSLVINSSQQQQQMGGMPPMIGQQFPQPMMPVPQSPQWDASDMFGEDMPVPDKVPKPAPLLEIVKEFEKPVEAFVMMSKAGDKDLENCIKQGKKLERKKDEERKSLQNVKNHLKKVEDGLKELDDTDLSENDVNSLKNDLLSNVDDLETELEKVESKQNDYQYLLDSEEEKLVKIVKNNKRALIDIENCIDALKKVSITAEMVSRFTSTAEQKHKLGLTEKEVDNIESFLENALENEAKLIEELEALDQVERQTEAIDESELEEIKNLIEEDQRIKKTLKKVKNHGNISNSDYNKFTEQINKLEKILKTLGKDIKQEEKLEEKIDEEANEGEKEINQAFSQDEQELNEAESKNKEAEQKTQKSSVEEEKEVKDWEELIKNPKTYMEPNKNLTITREQLNQYSGRGYWLYPLQDIDSSIPTQGFKIHITAYPHEAYKVCKEIVPILQELGIRHKIMSSLSIMKENMEDGQFTSAQGMKLMTIYPGIDQDIKQEFKFGDKKQNEEAFFINEKNTKEVIQRLMNNTTKDIRSGGPLLEENRDYLGISFTAKEYRIRDTRIHLTYSICSGDEKRSIIMPNGQKAGNWYKFLAKTDEDGNFIKTGDGLYAQNAPDNDKFRSVNGHFLGHLLPSDKGEKVKRIITDEMNDEAILGLDGRVAGAHYLPPPESIEKMKSISKEFN